MAELARACGTYAASSEHSENPNVALVLEPNKQARHDCKAGEGKATKNDRQGTSADKHISPTEVKALHGTIRKLQDEGRRLEAERVRGAERGTTCGRRKERLGEGHPLKPTGKAPENVKEADYADRDLVLGGDGEQEQADGAL